MLPDLFHASRRDFLAGVATAVGSAGLATFPCPLLAAEKKAGPNDRIRLGFIGLGGQGNGNLGGFLKSTDVVALCDVDSKRLGTAVEKVEKATGRKPAGYADYRKLLDDKTVDAVVISTPDHWHVLPAVHACMAGKDTYVEKPLTLTVAEGRVLANAAKKYGRVVQTGSQQRSNAKFRLACELVRNGRLGKIQTVKVGLPGVNFKGPPVPDAEAPSELDFDLWLGPAPKVAYNPKHVHYNFRFFWDYAGGQMTNWGAHHLDIAQWGLGTDATGPVGVEAKARFHKAKWYEVPEWFEITYRYASGVTVICGQGLRSGTTFIGEKGSIFVNRGQLSSDPAEIIQETLQGNDERLYVSNSHHGNWLECVRTRKAPICDAEIGHRSATVCHLGNIAVRTGRALSWDPAKEQLANDAQAAALLSKAYRAPWALPEIG
jgi:predicted dehydrogenase